MQRKTFIKKQTVTLWHLVEMLYPLVDRKLYVACNNNLTRRHLHTNTAWKKYKCIYTVLILIF